MIDNVKTEMLTINVFIASSYELSEQRVQIGDLIRRLSYELSPRGVCIRMLCWEDYHPEYKGTSKQHEYDENLVKKCDIFIGLFRNRCGKYTQHEINLAESLRKNVSILCLPPNAAHNELDVFLPTIPTHAEKCNDVDFLGEIEGIIRQYLKSNNIHLSDKASLLNNWRLYATIPDDLDNIRIPFSNMVRSMEITLEDTLGNYFILHPYRSRKNIGASDHYLCFIKDSWNNDDENEVKLAFNNTASCHLPETSLIYSRKGGKGEESNHVVIDLERNKEAFAKEFQDLDTVKSDLLQWALYHKMPLAIEELHVFSVKSDILYCFNRPFFYLPLYPDLYLKAKLYESKINRVDALLKKNRKDKHIKDKQTAIELAAKRKSAEDEFQSEVNFWYNNFVLDNYGTVTIPVTTREASPALISYNELNQHVAQLTVKCQSANRLVLNSMIPILNRWKESAVECLEGGLISPEDYIKVLIHIVRLCDTYFRPNHIEFDENTIFLQIVQTSDNYDYHTLLTEVIRVNYGNSFQGNVDYTASGKYYEQAYMNIIAINDDSLLAHKYKSYVMMVLLHHYTDIDDKAAAAKIGHDYESQILTWQKNSDQDFDVDLARCYAPIIGAAPKYKGVCLHLVEKAEDLLLRLHQKYDGRPYDEDYFDSICYLANCLSTYYLDRFTKGDELYYNKASQYINEFQNGLNARYPYDPEYITHFLSQPFHNRAFLYSKNGEWKKAISNYKSALSKRRAYYKDHPAANNLIEVAQTLINIGDAYRLNGKLDRALDSANEALSIYESLKRVHKEQVFEMYYYEAYQLKATILFDIDGTKGEYPLDAITMMHECIEWSNAHPNNDYKDRFNGVSGVYLNSLGLLDKNS